MRKTESEKGRMGESGKNLLLRFTDSPIPRFSVRSGSSIPRFSDSGFLILEVMIASLILTAGVAATMYLFRLGFQYLERANDSNLLSSKLPQVINYMKVLDMDVKQGTEDMGDDVIMHWDAGLVDTVRPFRATTDEKIMSVFNLYLYKVKIRLDYKKLSREYEMNVFRSSKVEKNPSPLDF